MNAPAPNLPRAALPSPPPAIEEPALDLRKYFLIFWKFKWVFLVVFLGVGAAVAYLTMSVPKIYQAGTVVQINPRTPQVINEIREVVELGTGTYWANKEFFTTQYQVIKSRAVAQRVAEREGLERDPDFLGLAKLQDPAVLAEASKNADAAGIVMGRINVVPIEGSHLARIEIEDTVPDRARRISIAVGKAYRDINLELKVRETVKALKLLGTQKDELVRKLEEAEKKLVEFKRQEGILTISLSDRQNVVTQDLLAFAAATSKAESELITLRAQLEQARKRDGSAFKVTQQHLESESKSFGVLSEQVEKVRQERSELGVRYLEKHPKVEAIDKKLQLVQTALDAEKAYIKKQAEARFDAELTALKRKVAAADRNFSEHKKLVTRTNQRAQQYSAKELDILRLQREVEDNRRTYQVLAKRYKEVDIAKEIHNNNVSVLDEAKSAILVRPRLLYSLVFAIGLALMAGLGMVLVLNFFDKTIKSQEDIERTFGLNFLGVVPTVRDESGGKIQVPELHVHSHPKSTVAELVRSVRTNIQFMSPDRPLKKLVITSAQPLEGKTTVTLSLGISMAQAGNRVVVVSSDMRRPRIHQPFGLRGKRGISNWIVDEATLDEVLHHTVVPGLDLLPCGPIPPNPAEILQADKFHRLVEELEKRYDRILFDSPPIGAVTDPLILAAMADGVILVLQAGMTTKDMLRHAYKKLRTVNAHLLGCVLNNLDLQSTHYGSQYYRKGYYYAADEDKASGT